MDLPRTRAVAARVEWVDEAGSTNTELVARATGSRSADWPTGSVLVTDTQTAGRGRLGRPWTAPPGSSLAISLLLRPSAPPATWGWLPLLAGGAMVGAVRAAGADADLKWPNDVLVDGRKVCGVLAEVLPDGAGVVVGAGLNHLLERADLPVPTATSLLLEGASTDVDAVVADYLQEALVLFRRWDAAGGDARGSGLHAAVATVLGTLGRRVRVTLPGGAATEGRAVALDADGRVVVQPDGAGPGVAEPQPVSAGDVEHLRYE